jgi:hypothetical protein
MYEEDPGDEVVIKPFIVNISETFLDARALT